MAEVTLGGERLGSGKKEKVYLKEYERSTHDLSYTWRSTMAAGTLVPFMSELGLPGDTFDIDLNVDIMTHPTIGPLFGSYKVQLDLFQVPIRLYNAQLHMNKLGIGLNMKEIYLPSMLLEAAYPNGNTDIDNQQINPSSIFKYLGISGCGFDPTEESIYGVQRGFNAVPYLGYFDIYKNYYSNKQEEIGYIIHNNLQPVAAVVDRLDITTNTGNVRLDESNEEPTTSAFQAYLSPGIAQIVIDFDVYEEFDINRLYIWWDTGFLQAQELFATWTFDEGESTLTGSDLILGNGLSVNGLMGTFYIDRSVETQNNIPPKLVDFRLSNIDGMRLQILRHDNDEVPFVIKREDTLEPYCWPFYNELNQEAGKRYYSCLSNQEGLLIKTYQSDLFNNWMSTEWIDGENGINEITRISTEAGYITIDEINLSKKIYMMLNRIAISGGSYDDWLDATYTHERVRSVENPIYCGGLSRELVFQEVVSTASQTADAQPLGTLAGKGVLTSKRKGGKARIKIDEPSYVMGIISLTPRIDYSQGNKWDTNLQTLDDFHKPQLSQIGFQDLITDQMAWWDTQINSDGIIYKSAGKQPAWINYMTNVNKVYGNFAIQSEQMYMTLNRRYESKFLAEGELSIKDLTTYVDPSKFNHIFADTRLDAQNFWAQIAVDCIARRKMSAKVMPNL